MPRSGESQVTLKPQRPKLIFRKSSTKVVTIRNWNTFTLTDTYSVAVTCRQKLGKEARRADHELRRLVGHANMLDSLMGSLMQAEREYEGRINALIRGAPKPQQPRNVQCLNSIAEKGEEAGFEGDSDEGSDDDVRAETSEPSPVRKVKGPQSARSCGYFDESGDWSDEDDDVDDDEADDGELTLERWPSNTHLPDLTDEREQNSEVEGLLPSLLNDTSLISIEDKCSTITKGVKACLETCAMVKPMLPAIAIH